MTPPQKDTWAGGDLSGPYAVHWSRLVGREFLTWLAQPDEKTLLDVECGTGAPTETILQVAN